MQYIRIRIIYQFDGSFNTNFLKLSGADRSKNLKLAKTVPFSDTNKNLKKYEFAPEAQKPGSMWQLLMAMKECGLKNDALMDTFYDVVMEKASCERACKADGRG